VATRFYLPSTGAAPVNPAFNTSWDESASADRLKCVVTKINSAMADKTVAKGTGATRALVRQYVSDPIAAQTIHGTATSSIKGQVRCLESAANDNLDLVPCCIRIVSNDGSTYRSPDHLALGDYASALEFATSLTNRKIADGDPSSAVNASQGDRLVIEIGEKNSATGSSVSGSFNFGDNSGTDLPEDTTTTAANNPWIELQNDIAFVGDATLGPWSDNLNAQQAPLKSLKRLSQTVTAGSISGGQVGASTVNDRDGQKFTADADGKLVRVLFWVASSGSPTDSIVCKLYDDNAGVPGNLLATSLPIAGPAVGSNQFPKPFEFPVSYSLVNGNVYYAVLNRTGSVDGTNFYTLDGTNTNPYAGGHHVRFSSGAWVSHTGEDLSFHIEQETNNWYKFEIDRDNSKLQCFRSTDAGTNWTEQDGSNAPALANALGRYTCAVQRRGSQFYVVVPGTIESIKKTFPFATSSNTWGSATTTTFSQGGIGGGEIQFGNNVGDVCPVFHNYREFSSVTDATKDFSVFQSDKELVSGSRFRRIRTQFGTSVAYLTGSTTSVHYDNRAMVTDWRDWSYFFYTKSDSTQIQVATLAYDSTTVTVVGGLSVSAVDQAAKYPLGQGCHFWRDSVNYVAIPYVDGSNVKVLYCESGSASNTASNWQSSTATSIAAESSTSNPGFLAADNEQGGKLFLFFVDDSTGDLKWVHDTGSFTWSEPEIFYSGSDVTGCAGSLSDGVVGMLLRDSSTLELIFKTFEVFF
jgi:hypothetical protein